MRALAMLLVACGSPRPAPAPLAHHEPAPATPPAPAVPPGTCVDRDEVMPGGAPGTSGDLDRDLVVRAFRDHAHALRACYVDYLEHGSLHGRINAQFTIIGDGTVGRARATGFDDALARCVCVVVAHMTFAPARGATVLVTYPIEFQPSDGP